MLEHTQQPAATPSRVVIIGSRGVLGKPTVDFLQKKGVDVLAVSSTDLDLLDADAGAKLAKILRPEDSVVMFSALTPDKGRDIATLMKNLRMAEAVCQALAETGCAHAVYISSDAVYPFPNAMITEETPAAPEDLYGTMHRARDVIFQNATGTAPLAILRCTMVLSASDTHNSYGPNRFRSQAEKDGKITLGGEGEETRDHILAEDVAHLVWLTLMHKSDGILNVVTGTSLSFGDVARMVATQYDPSPELIFTERNNAITYRHFDITNLLKAFPEFKPVPLDQAIAQVHQKH